MQNSVVVFSFSVLDRKNPFWANLVQKIKIVSLSWNLVPRLIRILEFNGDLHFFFFYWKHPFWANLVQKFKIVCLNWNLLSRLIRICRIQWWCSLFSVLDRRHPFLRPWGSKNFEIASCRQHGSFILLWWVRPWIAF